MIFYITKRFLILLFNNNSSILHTRFSNYNTQITCGLLEMFLQKMTTQISHTNISSRVSDLNSVSNLAQKSIIKTQSDLSIN